MCIPSREMEPLTGYNEHPPCWIGTKEPFCTPTRLQPSFPGHSGCWPNCHTLQRGGEMQLNITIENKLHKFLKSK